MLNVLRDRTLAWRNPVECVNRYIFVFMDPDDYSDHDDDDVVFGMTWSGILCYSVVLWSDRA